MRKSMKLKTATIAVLLTAIISPAFAAQPMMHEALEHLRAARAALVRAERNKAGHRERALEHVEAAIREVEAGMAAAR
jgi:hypothetical protein